MIPKDVILIWTGTNATIPTGWERVVALDSMYCKATAALTDPGSTGGSNTHSHTSPNHTHTQAAHTHTGCSWQPDISGGWGKDANNENQSAIQDMHIHQFTSDASTDGSLVDSITYQIINHEPPHRKVIFIKPSGGFAPLSDKVLGFLNSTTLPTGYSFCDGTNTTPDLRNRYLKGAGTDEDADVTTNNGSLTHTHTVDHTHTQVGHTHSGRSDTGQSGAARRGSSGGNTCNSWDHTHGFGLTSRTTASGAYSGTVTSGTVEPSYKKLVPIQNTSGHANMQKGIIGMWLGTLASIPIGWRLCDGTHDTFDLQGLYVKSCNITSEVGNIGGANTHIHASSNSHSHSGASHNHDVPGMAQEASPSVNPSGGGYKAIQANHVHNQPYDGHVDNSTTSYNSTEIYGNSSNNEPAYTTVAFIQYEFSTGGALMTGFL